MEHEKKNKKPKDIQSRLSVINKIIDNKETLENGVTIYYTNCHDRSYIIFSKLGFVLDLTFKISGIVHFFEHFAFKNMPVIDDLNATTHLSYMTFQTLNKSSNSFKKLIEMFYDENYNPKLEDLEYCNDHEMIENVSNEIENEFYLRYSNNKLSCIPVFFFTEPIINTTGRKISFNNKDKIGKIINKIWKSIDPKDIIFVLPEKLKSETKPLIEKTFGKKQKTYEIKHIFQDIKLPEVKNITNPFVSIEIEIGYMHLIFKFKKSERDKVYMANTILKYITNFSLLFNIVDIYNFVFVEYTILSQDMNHLKAIVYSLKNLNVDSFLLPDDFKRIFGFSHCKFSPDFINTIIVDRDEIKKVMNITYEEMIFILRDYFKTLQKKITTYGEFIISTNSTGLYSSADRFNILYDVRSCNLDNFVKIWGDINLCHSLFEEQKWIFINNVIEKHSCKYYEHVNHFKISGKNYYSIEIDRNNIRNFSSLLGRSLRIGKINRDSIILKSKSKELIEFIKNDNVLAKTPDLTLENMCVALEFFFRDSENLDIDTESVDSINKKCLEDVYNCKFGTIITNNRICEVITPYKFVSFFFRTNSPEIGLDEICCILKYKGLIYSSYGFLTNNYGFIFFPTVFTNEVMEYTENFFKSFDPDIKYIITISKEGDRYDFSNLNRIYKNQKIFL